MLTILSLTTYIKSSISGGVVAVLSYCTSIKLPDILVISPSLLVFDKSVWSKPPSGEKVCE